MMATKTIAGRTTDTQLQQDVEDELFWEPSTDAAEIGVIVQDGIVTLTDTVNSLHQKRAAERAAYCVAGVKGVIEKIDIKSPSTMMPILLDQWSILLSHMPD
jgi:osmotically-inducible protein OsmY